MKIIFSEHAWQEYLFWQTTDRKVLLRINSLIREIQRSPFEGIGKPEPLRENLSGFWSRRIDDTHRLVYTVEGEAVAVVACRYHYE